VLAIFDKPDPLDGPFFEETIYVTPSRLAARRQVAIVETTTLAARALGLHHGPIHAECRVNDSGVFMLEVAARPIGGLCARTLRFTADARSGGLMLEDLLLRHAVGLDISQFGLAAGASGVMMIPVPRRGYLRGVEGLDRARAVPGIEDAEITAKQDQLLEPWPEGASYLGFLFARGEHPAACEASLREGHGRLRFEIETPLPVL
jgi:hypothetical protein